MKLIFEHGSKTGKNKIFRFGPIYMIKSFNLAHNVINPIYLYKNMELTYISNNYHIRHD